MSRPLTPFPLLTVVAATLLTVAMAAPSAPAQTPAHRHSLPLQGDVSTPGGDVFNIDGTFTPRAVDVTAGELVLLGSFDGALTSGGGAATRVTTGDTLLPVTGASSPACDALEVDPSVLLIDSLGVRSESSQVLLELRPDEAPSTLIDGLCRLVATLQGVADYSIDAMVPELNQELRP